MSVTEQIEVNIKAVIYLGPGSMGLVLTEVCGEKVKLLDFLTQAVPVARDIFRLSYISRHTMDRCVQIMSQYMDVIREYELGKTPVETKLALTNIVTEASNVDVFINRMHVAHGIRARVIDDGKMTRMIYMKVQDALAQYPDFKKKTTMVIHVGPGNTRILLFVKGRIARYSSHRLGTHRTGEAISELDFGDDVAELSVMREHIRGQLDQIYLDYKSYKGLDRLIIIGEELQSRRKYFQKNEKGQVDIAELGNEAERMAKMTLERRMVAYGSHYAMVDSLLPAVMINLAVAQFLKPKEVVIPSSNYEQELILSYIRAEQHPAHLEAEVLHFAESIARQYQVDDEHSRHVRKLCDQLFTELQNLHRLSARDRLLLNTAATLHEVGVFISQRHHHLHSEYIILNSEIFGLSRDDVVTVALLARYHRRNTPSKKDKLYRELDQNDRMRITKMAALLRVADALERGHSQRVTAIKATPRGKMMELALTGVQDTTVEGLAMKLKGNLFTDIFGYDIELVAAKE